MTLIFERPLLRSAASALREHEWVTLISPHRFYRVAERAMPCFAAIAVLLCACAIFFELLLSPAAAPAAYSAHILFIHEPAAWMSLFLLAVMAFWGIVWLAFRLRLSRMLLFALAPTGALFTFLALWTGSLWGKPNWGTWWMWDARLTAELVLLILYASIMALHAATLKASRGDDAASIVALCGVVAVPVVYCAMFWAAETHDSRFVGLTGAPAFESKGLLATVLMTLSLWMYSFATSLLRVRAIILERERDTDWVAAEMERHR
jgi:heme exporter protein C